MAYNKYNIIFPLLILLLVFSCNIQIKVSNDKEEIPSESVVKIVVENTEEKSYNGWWIYGEGQHIFKDEEISILGNSSIIIDFTTSDLKILRNNKGIAS